MSYYVNTRSRTNWLSFLDAFGKKLLSYMGYELPYSEPPSDRNVITELLKTDPDTFVKYAIAASSVKNGDALSLDEKKKKINRAGVCRAIILLQMRIYDRQRGPEQDGRPKALRRHWYAYFKQNAQMLAFAIGDVKQNAQGADEMTDIRWTARLSESYAALVDSGEVTYRQLWVEDASRMISGDGQPLFSGLNLVLAVEKDSLFNDFRGAAKALGAKGLISGKGKNSKAAMEKFLREAFYWSEESNSFSIDNPLIVLHISDYDYDGHAVIGPTFGEQARRYTPHVIEARVGVKPEQVMETVPDAWDAAYQIKLKDDGYVQWAEKYALYAAECNQCGHTYFTIGTADSDCPQCGGEGALQVLPDLTDEPRGYEVESLRSRDYYKALVDTLIQVVPFKVIIRHLREEAIPDAYSVGSDLRQTLLEQNENYQKIVEARSLLQDMESAYAGAIEDKIHEYARTWINNHPDEIAEQGEDPELSDFQEWVIRNGGSDWASPWRPIDMQARVTFIEEQALVDNDDLDQELAEIEIDNLDENVAKLRDLVDGIDLGDEDEE